VQFDRKVFLEGAAGTGKTTFAIEALLRLLDEGIMPDRVLVLVPQVTLARPYQLAIHGSSITGGAVNIQTLAGIARRAVETYWPILATPMGFAEPNKEPVFLNIETAQYFMARMVSESLDMGVFAGLTIAPPRIITQVFDNLNRAVLMRFPLDEVAARLTAAWGAERDSARPPAYEAALGLAKQFREYCLSRNLLDYSLMLETFRHFLDAHSRFATQFARRFDYVVADNLEEMNPAGHDFIRWLLPRVRGGMLLYDEEAGYRVFLGADPDYGYNLANLCERRLSFAESQVNSPELKALTGAFARVLGPVFEPPADGDDPTRPLRAFTYQFHRFYPQMVAWTAERIIELVNERGVLPSQIVVLAPYLNDSLRFSLEHALREAQIPTVSHRPSRSLRDEPATRTLLTLAALAHPEWKIQPQALDVADALHHSLAGLDPARARLLAAAIYRPNTSELTPFATIEDEMRGRITYVLGERYEVLRTWLLRYRESSQPNGAEGTPIIPPLDHFFSRLFGEVLSQPGFGFHTALDAGRVTAQLIASAQGFRETLYSDKGSEAGDWSEAGREYVSLINQRVVSALFVQNWQDENADAVFIAPAFTFLMRNRPVEYQFWLDVGSSAWSERLEQPLTHPYVLKHDYPAAMVWTDEMEADAERDLLYKLVVGLARRCRKQVYLGIADLGESGFEARGSLLRTFQNILSEGITE
jgi:hypothetical protein